MAQYVSTLELMRAEAAGERRRAENWIAAIPVSTLPGLILTGASLTLAADAPLFGPILFVFGATIFFGGPIFCWSRRQRILGFLSGIACVVAEGNVTGLSRRDDGLWRIEIDRQAYVGAALSAKIAVGDHVRILENGLGCCRVESG